ncbi:MAG: WYL domain-containing protein [Lachnospiraceae bacterium]|nr:WYL domain-containing protein [Lachnospiraceae bacterium]
MPRSANQKLKLLYLKDILSKYTDEDHPLSATAICDILRECDVDAERKSIYDDMGMLAAYGLDIMKINGRDGGFFLGEREFELAELKLLIDAVMSSKFITKRKSDQLIKKITAFASNYDSDELKRQLHSINRIKGQNESILYTVDDINAAIRNNKKIEFKYCEWTKEIKLRPKKNGDLYVVSPITLIWDDEYYYLVAYDSEAGIVKHYRVDKIKDIAITDEAREKPAEKIDMSAYSGKMFGMFGGKTVTVGFQCPEDKIGILIDRFGQDVKVTGGAGDRLTVHTQAVLSGQFYGWVASVGPDIRLVSPSEAVNGMRDFLKENLDCY